MAIAANALESNVINMPAQVEKVKKPRVTRKPAKTVAPIVEKPKRAKRETSADTPKKAKIENDMKPSRIVRRIMAVSQNAQTRMDALFAFVFGASLSVLAWLSMHHAHVALVAHAGQWLTVAICIGAFAISGVKVYSYALGAADFGNPTLNKLCAFGTVLLLDGLSAFGPGYVSVPCMVILAIVNGLSQAYVMTKNSPVLEKKKGTRKKSA